LKLTGKVGGRIANGDGRVFRSRACDQCAAYVHDVLTLLLPSVNKFIAAADGARVVLNPPATDKGGAIPYDAQGLADAGGDEGEAEFVAVEDQAISRCAVACAVVFVFPEGAGSGACEVVIDGDEAVDAADALVFKLASEEVDLVAGEGGVATAYDVKVLVWGVGLAEY